MLLAEQDILYFPLWNIWCHSHLIWWNSHNILYFPCIHIASAEFFMHNFVFVIFHFKYVILFLFRYLQILYNVNKIMPVSWFHVMITWNLISLNCPSTLKLCTDTFFYTGFNQMWNRLLFSYLIVTGHLLALIETSDCDLWL